MTVSSNPDRLYVQPVAPNLNPNPSSNSNVGEGSKEGPESLAGILGDVLHTSLPTVDSDSGDIAGVSDDTTTTTPVVPDTVQEPVAPVVVIPISRPVVQVIDEEFVKNTRNMLFERLGQMDCDVDLPHTLRVLTRLLKKITVGKTYEFSSSIEGDVAAIELMEFAEKPEVGVYYSSLSALLFLRLICPAIIGECLCNCWVCLG